MGKSDSQIETSITVNYIVNARDALTRDGHETEAQMAEMALELFRSIEKRLAT